MGKSSAVGTGVANVDPEFWDFALKYHEKEPFIANVVILLVATTPIILGVLYLISKQKQSQVDDRKNILHYQTLMTKIKGNKK